MPVPVAAIGAIGSVLGGAGSLFGAIRGGADQTDYASLYSTQLAPGNTALTIAGQELATLMAPYTGTEAAQTKVLGQQAYDQFTQAANKEQTQAGLQAGIASQYASNVLGLQDLQGKAKLSTEMLGPEVAASLAKQYGEAAQSLQEKTLTGETSLLNPTAQGLAQAGLSAQTSKNKQVNDLMSSNLRISERQEDTRNALALQRGQIEGQLALKRFGAGMALAGHQAFG
jgi:hypothetical protein